MPEGPMKSILTITVIVLSIVILSHVAGSCKRQQQPLVNTALQQSIPSNLGQPVYKFEDNPLSEEAFQFGRRLFYDGRLSRDSQFPCASCHQQIAAFGTYQHDRSHGYNFSHTLRNAPPLFNLAWEKELHWDGRFRSLYTEASQPILAPNEMAENFFTIIFRIGGDTGYQRLCRAAFGSPVITEERILKALAQFTGNITIADSRFDRYKKGSAALSTSELNGYQLYQAKCATCHPEPMFTDYSYRNIGLPVDTELNDYGRMRVTGNSTDSLKFKVPTLRNVQVTENYFHDGRFNTLSQVLDHYISGVQNSATLDPLLVNKIPLTPTEKTDVIAFLKTLTDSSILHNTRYSKPL